MKTIRGAAGLFVTLAALASAPNTASAWWWSSSSTYEECMLSEMKGQPQSMYGIADKLCARRHKKEQDIRPKDIKFKWTVKNRMAVIQITDSGEYEVTRLSVEFARKICKDTTTGDFKEPVMVKIHQGVGTTSLMASDFEDACMRIEEAWGMYK